MIKNIKLIFVTQCTFILFNDKVFSSPEEAQKEAEKIKKDRGESAPRRCT